ncbi:RNA polymerase sigma factor [Bordetella sp. H567]|uniref:RNA polymerase sigma factor n=1 Tax=Bordetella sp. H567 TaxID=1697043 RepID=UPI001F41FC78|nr:hypothetical protein [Bordetella sp. H567]
MRYLQDNHHGIQAAPPIAYDVATNANATSAGIAIATSHSAYEAVFRELVQNHATRLHRFIIKHIGNCPDAEDLTQQAFLERPSRITASAANRSFPHGCTASP